MLNLELGHGPRSLAMKDVDTSVFEMLVSESNDRNNACCFPKIVCHLLLQLGKEQLIKQIIFPVHRPFDRRQR